MKWFDRSFRRGLAASPWLLLLGMGALWTRSYSRHDAIECMTTRIESNAEGRQLHWLFRGVLSNHGWLVMDMVSGHEDARHSSNIPFGWTVTTGGDLGSYALPNASGWREHLFIFHPLTDDNLTASHYHKYLVGFPHWAPMALLGPLALTPLLRNFRKTRRRAAGLCTKCGYDLRATPERCPECGEVPAPSDRRN